ncbi:LOG family protein [Mariniluteicoccus flavus]
MSEHLEIETLAAFDHHTSAAASMHGWFVQSVDLTGRGDVLARLDPAGAAFLGCTFDDGVADALTTRGALVFPALPDLPFDPYRGHVYTADELYDSAVYADSLDARVYAWSHAQGHSPSAAASLAMALHDHAVTDALDEVAVDPSRVVGLMGGHALGRDTPAYADAARLGRSLAERGLVVLTGGGPGAMEAANLGAWFAGRDGLDEALAILAEVPSFRPGIDAWARTAFEVRRRWPQDQATPGDHPHTSLAIPTWFYGHEPPNAFGTHIAKYFANALREDTLLHRCRAGIVYLPGAAGTLQEIFQAATPNYYATDPTTIAPMVLVGRHHWTEKLPAWQLLTALADGRPMAGHLHLVDDIAEVTDLLAP